MDSKEVDLKFLFPNLIVFLSSNKNESLLKQLTKSFNEFCYGPLFKEEGCREELGRRLITCRIMQGSIIPVCLAEGKGDLLCDAEQQAAENLLNKLCESFYVIKANPQYFTKKNVPPAVLDVDPSQSHVYKVVLLKNNSRGLPFPKPVSGAIDYVETYDELMKYVDNHTKSDTNADIFILNVLKSDRAMIRQVCQKNGFTVKFLVGCSDMGIHAFRNLSTLMIQQSLLKDGGKNVKYKLIGPRDKYGHNEHEEDQYHGEKVAAVMKKHTSEEEGEIVISPWIAERLVIMEGVTESNELEYPKDIIWRSVRDCPDTHEFIIEKMSHDTGMIYADAMIDRNVVGRARGLQINSVKTEAAKNAMENLKKYCYYIVAKESYFGSKNGVPNFLKGENPTPETKIYRIADILNDPPNKILQKFKTAWQEDLYFLDSYTPVDRREIALMAMEMGFLVRWIGSKHYLCVYKRRKPREVLMELLSTKYKENEKYKLLNPTFRVDQQKEGTANQEVRDGREFSQSISQTIKEEPYDQPDQPSGQDHQPTHGGEDSNSQSRTDEDTSAGGSDETPDWVMKFIQSAPKKPPKQSPFKKSGPKQPERHRDDVYSRYKFKPPRVIPPPGFEQGFGGRPNQNFNKFHGAGGRNNPNFQRDFQGTGERNYQNFQRDVQGAGQGNFPNFQRDFQVAGERNNPNFQRDVQGAGIGSSPNFQRDFHGADERINTDFHRAGERSDPNFKRGNANLVKDEEQGSTLSERLHRWLQGQTVSTDQDPANNPNGQRPSDTFKRFHEQGFDFKEEDEPREKKPNFHSSRCGSSIEELSRSGKDWSWTTSNEKSFTDKTTFKIENTTRNCDEGSSAKVESEQGGSNASTQPSNSSLWNQSTKQQYDQRPIGADKPNTYAKLFDFSGPQVPLPQAPRPTFAPRPPAPWKKNNQFKGQSFSKLAKYGRKKGPRGPF